VRNPASYRGALDLAVAALRSVRVHILGASGDDRIDHQMINHRHRLQLANGAINARAEKNSTSRSTT